MVMVKNKKPPRKAGVVAIGSSNDWFTTNWLYFQVLGGRELPAAVVPFRLKFLSLLTSVGKRPFRDVFREKHFWGETGLPGAGSFLVWNFYAKAGFYQDWMSAEPAFVVVYCSNSLC
jgi:hypothetical protein